MIIRQVNYLSVINTDCHKLEGFIRVGEFDLEKFIWW